MENWMEKFADRLIKAGADPKNKNIIIYGIEGTLSEIAANIAAFTIAFLIGKPLEMLIWQVFWLPLRVNIGGHHAKHHISCLIYSTALAVGSVLILPYIVSWWWLIVIECIITFIIAFFYAPYVHPNRVSSQQHIDKVRKRGKIVASVEIIFIIALYFLCPAWVAHIAALGMFVATVLCIVGYLERFFINKKSN